MWSNRVTTVLTFPATTRTINSSNNWAKNIQAAPPTRTIYAFDFIATYQQTICRLVKAQLTTNWRIFHTCEASEFIISVRWACSAAIDLVVLGGGSTCQVNSFTCVFFVHA